MPKVESQDETRGTESVCAIRAKAVTEAKAEAERVRDIQALAKAYQREDLERFWIGTNATVDSVRQEILAGICERARPADAAWMPLFPESEPIERQSRRNTRPRTAG
jgi:hypothetical protein